jgi:hypothetical protein
MTQPLIEMSTRNLCGGGGGEAGSSRMTDYLTAISESLVYEMWEPRCLTTWTSTVCYTQTKQAPWPLVRERTKPTERPPLVDEI